MTFQNREWASMALLANLFKNLFQKKKKDTKSLQSLPENRNRGHTFSFIGEVVP